MSKLQTLGAKPLGANMARNIVNGVIADPIQLPEVGNKIDLQTVNVYQTRFRLGILSFYTQNDSIDNFVVNMALEGGFHSPIYRALVRLFTLTSLNLALGARRNLTDNELSSIARIVLVSNPAIERELVPLSRDPIHASWFNAYANLVNSQDGKMILANINAYSGGGGFNLGGSQASPTGGFGSSTNTTASGFGAPAAATTQAYVPSTTALGLDSQMGVTTPKPQAAQAAAITRVSNDILIVASKDSSYTSFLNEAMNLVGMWAVINHGENTPVLADDCAAPTYPAWHIWDDTMHLTNSMMRGNVLSYNELLTATGNVLKDEMESVLRTDEYKEALNSYQSSNLRMQLMCYGNSRGYVCELDHTPWGLPSIVDLLNEEVPPKLLASIADEDYQVIRLGFREYPIFRASCPQVKKLGRLFSSNLVDSNCKDVWYIFVPYITPDGVQLRVHNIMKGNTMDLSNYAPAVAGIKIEAKLENDGTPAKDPGAYLYPAILSGGINASINTMRVMSQDSEVAVIGDHIAATFMTISESLDADAYAVLKTEYTAGKIKSVWDLTARYSKLLEAGDCTPALVKVLGSRIQDTIMSALVANTDLDISLSDNWEAEANDLKDICENGAYLTIEQATLIKAVGNELLEFMFTGAEDEDELRVVVALYKAHTGIETRMSHGTPIARFASVDASCILNLKFGINIIPMITRNTLVSIAQSSLDINPRNANSLSGYKLHPSCIEMINKVVGTITLVTSDGVQYGVSVCCGDELDAPTLLRL